MIIQVIGGTGLEVVRGRLSLNGTRVDNNSLTRAGITIYVVIFAIK